MADSPCSNASYDVKLCTKYASMFFIFDDNKKLVYSYCEACAKNELKNTKDRSKQKDAYMKFIKMTEISKDEYLEVLRR